MNNESQPIDVESAPTGALIKLDENPAHLMRRATDVAGVSRDIVMRTAMKIQGRQYVRVEGWQAIAVAHGCVASARDVERVETGFRAIGEVRRMSDGVVMATAEGFVGNDESAWTKRPEYARRAMAQTRAISRACRSAFAHVVVLIDADLSTTPAEEVPDDGFTAPQRQQTPVQSPRPAQPATAQSAPPPEPPAPAGANTWKNVVVPKRFTKAAGRTLGVLREESSGYLIWLIGNMKAEPYNGRPPSQADVEFRAALDLADNDLREQTKSLADDARAAIDGESRVSSVAAMSPKEDDVPF